jgi:hypothetical protein
MRWIALAALLAATPVEAHCYERWYYPWPQRCIAHDHSPNLSRHRPRMLDVRVLAAVPPDDPDLDIPLPSLARADLDAPEADEAIRARVLLRAALEASQ